MDLATTNLLVTFYAAAEARHYELRLAVQDSVINIAAGRSEPGQELSLLSGWFAHGFSCAAFFNWVKADPMFHPGGTYGILLYCIEVLQAPAWLIHFALV